jgi:hypothetical protein
VEGEQIVESHHGGARHHATRLPESWQVEFGVEQSSANVGIRPEGSWNLKFSIRFRNG